MKKHTNIVETSYLQTYHVNWETDIRRFFFINTCDTFPGIIIIHMELYPGKVQKYILAQICIRKTVILRVT